MLPGFEISTNHYQQHMVELMCPKKRRPEYIFQLLVFNILILCMSECLVAQKKSIEPVDSSKVVQEVKDYSEKDNIFSRILRSVLVDEDEQEPSSAVPDPDRKIIKRFTGKVIRKINVEILDVFGASVDNPKDTVRSWIQERGNSLHINSKEWIIKNKLIISEGHIFNPFYVQESERIIRQSPYVYDVRIIPQKINNNPDSVDIMVYVQDIWSINGSASYSSGSKTGSASFSDLNFLGFGNEFKVGFKFDQELTLGWDWDGSYSIDNIERTFISANLYHLSERDRQQYGFGMSRDFLSPVISWGGGIAQHWQATRYPDISNPLGPVETARFNQQDYWLGYAFDLGYFDRSTEYQNRFNIAGRITRTGYSEKPVFDTTNIFQDNTFYLGRIGYSSRTYFQDSYIFGLGRTEDIPLINMIELLFGLEKGANSNRPYYGLKAGYSFYNDHLAYLYGGFQIGAFRRNEKWLNRTSILDLLYFSHLHAIGKWRWRHYIGSRFAYSDDPIRPEGVLNINDEHGLRGFSDSYLIGNKRLVLNYEADIFIPLKFLGFKLAFITFADFGLISTSNSSLFASKLYQGYGFGFRIKNEHLIFPTFQFMFGFYPNTPQTGGEHFNMFHQGSIFYQFNKFQFSTPSVVSIE